MNKKIVIGIIVMVVLALGAGAWYFTQKDETITPNTATTQPANQEQQTETSSPKTINGLMSAGANKKCTLSTTDGNAQVSGTIYIAGAKKMHGEYTTTSEGKNTVSNMIITKDVQYFWSPDSKQGVKINLSEATVNNQQQTSQQNPGGIDTDKEYDFSCSDWTVDEAKFVVPADVNFMDFSGIQQQLNQ